MFVFIHILLSLIVFCFVYVYLCILLSWDSRDNNNEFYGGVWCPITVMPFYNIHRRRITINFQLSQTINRDLMLSFFLWRARWVIVAISRKSVTEGPLAWTIQSVALLCMWVARFIFLSMKIFCFAHFGLQCIRTEGLIECVAAVVLPYVLVRHGGDSHSESSKRLLLRRCPM